MLRPVSTTIYQSVGSTRKSGYFGARVPRGVGAWREPPEAAALMKMIGLLLVSIGSKGATFRINATARRHSSCGGGSHLALLEGPILER